MTQLNGLSPKNANDPINIGCSFQNKQPGLTDLVLLLFNYNNEEFRRLMAIHKSIIHYDRKDLDYLDAPPLQLTSSGPAITATDA